MPNLVPKIPAQAWLEIARQTLVEEGVDAVKVDRLAQKLGVTRGGFYHHFADRGTLLIQLLELWRSTVIFIPLRPPPNDPGEALAMIEEMVDRLIDEDAYDPDFDMAIRAWAQADGGAASAISRADAERLAALEAIFSALGCDAAEAVVRAQVFYFHQIGYYAIGVTQSAEIRHRHVGEFIRILCGERNLEAARRWRTDRGPGS